MSKLERYLSYKVHGRTSQPQRKQPKRETGRGPLRSEDYKSWIRSLPCIACGAQPPNESAHTGHDGGAKQKASDTTCIPLCADCHRLGPHAYHGLNSSAVDFARRHGLDFAEIAARLHAEWRAERGAA